MWEPPSEVIELRKISFFRYLTDDDLARVVHLGVRRAYEAGTRIVQEGSDRGGFYVLLSGTAEADVGDVVHRLGPGDFFGELAMLTRSRRTASILAVEPVEAMAFETMDLR